MPIYEYECKQCGHVLEAMQKFSDAPLTDCPACQQPSLNKLISSTSFQLKGTGWYATDIRDKGKPKAESSTESSTENKTAAPTTPSDTTSKPSGSTSSNSDSSTG